MVVMAAKRSRKLKGRRGGLNDMEHYCFKCGTWASLDPRTCLCAGCYYAWLGCGNSESSMQGAVGVTWPPIEVVSIPVSQPEIRVVVIRRPARRSVSRRKRARKLANRP